MTQGTTKGVPIDTDPTLALNSNQVVPSQAAVVTYVGARTTTFPVTVPNGGTGATTLTNHGVLLGQATNAVTATAVGAKGTLLVGATAADPAFATSATGDFTFTSATAGETRLFTVSNTDNTNTDSNATIKCSTGGASAGDARYSASTTTTEWSFGVDNSVTSPGVDPFVISQGAVLGTNNVMSIKTTGEINYPLQPAFLATGGVAANVTGDGTVYTLTYTTEVFDQNGDFASNTFTAPVTGRYFLCVMSEVSGITSAMTAGNIYLNTSNRNYVYNVAPSKIFDSGTKFNMLVSSLCDMDAGDTCATVVSISNGTKVADISFNHFSGYLAC